MKLRLAVTTMVLLMPHFAGAVDDPHAHHRHATEPDGSPILVTINPEARVSVRLVAALPPAPVCGSALDIAVKVVNQGYVTAPLQVFWLSEPPPGASLTLLGDSLSGAAEERRILRVTLTNPELTDVTIGFNTRNNIPDIGGRDRVHFLLNCLEIAN